MNINQYDNPLRTCADSPASSKKNDPKVGEQKILEIAMKNCKEVVPTKIRGIKKRKLN